VDVKNSEFNMEEDSFKSNQLDENFETEQSIEVLENSEKNLNTSISENINYVENEVANQSVKDMLISGNNIEQQNVLSSNLNQDNNTLSNVNTNQMNFDPFTGRPLNINQNNNVSNNMNTNTGKKKKGKIKFVFLGLIVAIILAIFISKLFEPDKVTKTDYIQIDAIYVDDSVIEGEDEELRTVYVFYTATAKNKNLKVDAKAMNMKFEGSNSYESIHSLGDKKNFFSNYYYRTVLEDIYVGSSLKLLETFEIPVGELTPGKTVRFTNYHYSDTRKLKMSTDDFKHMKNFEEIAKDIDPDAYYKEVDLRSDADAATTKKVKNAINDYYWKFYTNMMWYKLEFFAPNDFNISGSVLSNKGKYYVKKGYVALSYDNGYTYAVYIKYNFKENGDINLEVADSFSVF